MSDAPRLTIGGGNVAFNVTGLRPKPRAVAHFVADVVKDSLQTAGTYHIGPKQIPEYSIVVNGFAYVETAFVTGTSISLGILAAADLLSAANGVTANLTLAAPLNLVPTEPTVATWLLTTTADRDLILVTVGAYTVGRIHVWLEYVTIKP